jgi:gliding motility-associatede transport system auxiliary component
VTANHCDPSRWAARARHAARLLVALVVAITVAWYSTRAPLSRDVTRTQTHTLSTASIAVMGTLPGPITITAYLAPKSTRRAQVEHLIDRYRRHRPDIDLLFIDPASEPERVRAEVIRDGELLVRSGERTERTGDYTEQAVTEALGRLARAADRWIVFVTGHGERSPRRGANHDVSNWAAVLGKRGFNVQQVNLAQTRAVPDNTSVLVIASPQLDYTTAETAAVVDFLARGGNLLWLTEPDAPPAMQGLARAIGFERIPGTIVDPLTLAHGLDNPAFVLLSRYAEHPAMAGFDYTTVMFYAAGIHDRAPPGWAATRLILSGEKAWSETAVLEGNVAYDEGADFMGPLPLALAFTRTRDGRQQRVVVVGDGDFLANTYLQNSGNQDLGVRFVEWLARDDTLIAVPSRAAEDNALVLKDWHKAVIGFGFLVGLPGAFALNGLLIWWRRRRA